MDYTEKIEQAQERLAKTPSINFLIRELPQGKYDVQIQKIELKNRNYAPRIPYFVIKSIIMSGRYENYIISDIVGLTEKSSVRALSRVLALAEMCGVDVADLKTLEEITAKLDDELTGKNLRVTARKDFKQKAVINYLEVIE